MSKDLPPIEETIALAKREVLEDIADGIVPDSAASFAELHDYVDANSYGGAFDLWQEGDADNDANCSYWNAVQDAIDSWIKSGRN